MSILVEQGFFMHRPSQGLGSTWHRCCLIMVGSVGLCLATFLLVRSPGQFDRLDADELEYFTLAGQMLDGTYDFHPRRVIGHTLILAAVRQVFDSRFLLVQIAMLAAFATTAPLAYLLARREFRDEGAALLGGLAVMTWPLYLRYGTTIYSETIALPFFALFLLTLPGPSAKNGGTLKRLFLAGFMMGLCMHIRPMYLIYSPLGALVVYLRGPGGKAALARVAALTLGCLLIVLPWSAFMSMREGTLVLLCGEGGETIAGGLNPELIRMDATPEVEAIQAPDGRNVWVGPGKWLTAPDTGYLSQTEMKLPYSQVSDLLTQRTIHWVTQNPGNAAYLEIRKLLYMWGYHPFWNGAMQTVLGNIPIIILQALALATLWRLREFFRPLSIFWTLPLFVSTVALISWGSWRFRQPGDLGLLLLAAALPFVSRIRQKYSEQFQATYDSDPPEEEEAESLCASPAEAVIHLR